MVDLPATVENVLINGDLAKLKPEERIAYYNAVCKSVGLNPLTRPFEYIVLQGRTTLYARKDATDQLRSIHNVSIKIVGRELVEGCYIVTAQATMPSGRTDESVGALSIDNLKGEARANAVMKTETKAKRRVTLSICGLGLLDETEIETIPNAVVGELAQAAEPIRTFRKLAESTASNKGQAEPASMQKGESAAEAVEVTAKAAGEGDTTPAAPRSEVDVLGEKLAKLAADKKAVGKKQKEPESEFIDAGRAANLNIRFRTALPKALHPEADQLLHEWLKDQGIVLLDGEPSKYAIRKENFALVREQALQFAKTFSEANAR
jgi:hypothetical protein